MNVASAKHSERSISPFCTSPPQALQEYCAKLSALSIPDGPMTGLVRWVSLRKIAPARPCSQYPNYAVQYFSIVEMPIMGLRPKRPWEASWGPRLGGLPSKIFQTPPAWRAIVSIPYRPLVAYGARRSCSLSLAASVFLLNSSRAFPTRMIRSFTMDSTPRTLLTLCST